MGRKTYKYHERLWAIESITITTPENKVYEAITKDVSESGLSFVTKAPLIIDDIDKVNLIIETEKYKAHLSGRLIHVVSIYENEEKLYKYAVKIIYDSEQDTREYLQIIHDRQNSLPNEMNKWGTSFDDMKRNVQKRMEKQ